MKILLDECLPIAFRHSFPDHEVHSAEWAGFKGMKNGALLRAAEDGGYDVLLTNDQGIPHQQSAPAGSFGSSRTGKTPEWLRRFRSVSEALS
jgi:predicted nuclease of predicted toxin-antitoxin system